jgi:hypothetical protein
VGTQNDQRVIADARKLVRENPGVPIEYNGVKMSGNEYIAAVIDRHGTAKKIGNGTVATAMNPVATPPMMLRSSGNVPSPALLGNEGSAVNQGQALGVGTANLNDAKSRQQSAPPMMLSTSADNSQTSNSNVSNNYTSGDVSARDRDDPFMNYMPLNAAK